MDQSLRSAILDAPAVVTSFDGTLTRLAMDWAQLAITLAEASGALGHAWDTHSTLDINLRRIRRESEDDFHTLCGRISETEVAAFDPTTVHAPLVRLLTQRNPGTTAIVTTRTRVGVRTLLRHDAFGGLAPHLIAKEDVWQVKPDAEGLARLFEYMEARPMTSLYIGHDLRCKHAAETEGLRFIAVDDLTPSDRAPQPPSRAASPTNARFRINRIV